MVFISYKSEEYHIARRIRLLLEENHYPCWMAPESIAAGGNYMTEIPKAIRACDLFILIVSKSSQNSQWVQKELDRAVKFNKYILPFHVDDSELIDAIDFVISNNQRIEAYHNFEPACRELLATVRMRHPALDSTVPTPDPVPAAATSIPSLDPVPVVAPMLPPEFDPSPVVPEVTVPTLEIPKTVAPAPVQMPKPCAPMPKPTPIVAAKPLTGAANTVAQPKPNAAEPTEERPAVKAPVRQVSVQEMRGTYERNFEQNNLKGFKITAAGELVDYKPGRKEEGIVVIPFGVREIAGSVFAKCKSMRCVVLPPTLEKIGTNAFLECTSLDKVIFHEGLTHIDVGAFQGCNLLKKMSLPRSLTHIGAYAFFDCTNASFALPSSVEYIGAAAFNNCASVTEQAPNAKYTVHSGCIINVNHCIVSATADAMLPVSADIKEIGDYAFEGNRAMTRLNVPNHVKKIGMGAFRNCVNLTEVHLETGVDTVESQAFMGCTSLQELTMEFGLTTIEPQAFAQCKSLKRVTLPKSVRSRAKNAFEGCPRIKITE